MKKICAIIVTYNRSELLCRCIEKLQCQDYPLDILIYDNHSPKSSKDILSKKGLINDRVFYYYADSNTGGSGGFHNAMNLAIKKNYDALWLMDDDGYPICENTLSTIIKSWGQIGFEVRCILNSLVVCDIESMKLSFSMDREFDGKKIINRAEKGLIKDLNSPFNGTFIPTEFVKIIGFPIKEFFVYGDETEYMLRAKSFGGNIYTVANSLYFHPTTTCNKKRFLWREFSVSNVPLWKTYCMARNSVYYYKIYFTTPKLIKKIFRLYIECLQADDRKRSKLIETTRGIRDGLKSDFNRKLDLTK